MKIPREMKVDILHGDELGITAACPLFESSLLHDDGILPALGKNGISLNWYTGAVFRNSGPHSNRSAGKPSVQRRESGVKGA